MTSRIRDGYPSTIPSHSAVSIRAFAPKRTRHPCAPPPRTLRRFRPLTDILESLAPVSSLIPGLSATATGGVEVGAHRDEVTGNASGIAHQTIARPSLSLNAKPVSPSGTTAGSRGSTAFAAISATTAQTNPAQPLAGGLVTLATPSSPSDAKIPIVNPRPQASPGASPRSGGNVLNTILGSQATTASVAAPMSTPIFAAAISSSGAGQVRPMTLSPAPRGAGGHASQGNVQPFDSSGGSGGGTPPDMPPNLFGSGGGSGAAQVMNNGQPVPGQYAFSSPVPIGASMGFIASDPDPAYQITTNNWSGGTNYSSYTSVTPVTIITGGQSLGKSVGTDGSNYSFILDANARAFTITDQVTYSNGAHGTSTATFTSVAPTGSLTVSNVGTQTAGSGPNAQFAVGLSPGIKIQATASTGQFTAGSFMFLQILNSTYQSRTSPAGVDVYLKNDTVTPGGQNFNGPLHDADPLGYPFAYSGGSGGGGPSGGGIASSSGFYLTANNSMPFAGTGTPELSDAPSFIDSANNRMMTRTDKFSTYLMYKPTGGVWIALSQADWNWSETATLGIDGALFGPTSPQPTPTIKVPSGDGVFPVWVNTTRNYLDAAQNPQRPGNPGP